MVKIQQKIMISKIQFLREILFILRILATFLQKLCSLIQKCTPGSDVVYQNHSNTYYCPIKIAKNLQSLLPVCSLLK